MKLDKLYNNFRPYFLISLIVVVSSVLLWLPFLLRQPYWFGLKIENTSFDYVYRHFDGLLYIIPAKTLYDIKKIDVPGMGLIVSLPLSAKYFAAHLPLYPLLIRIFAYIVGYLKSMLLVNLMATVFLASFFYYLVKKLNLTSQPLILTSVFLFLPRFLIVRSIGAPESLFILLLLISLFFFEKKNYLLAGIFGGLSVMTKTPGILLFPVYFLTIIEKYWREKKLDFGVISILLIPMSLIAVFLLYYFQMGDFFAYFHTGGVVAMPYPFSVFNWQAQWVGTAWLEDIIFYLFLYGLMVISMVKIKQRSFFYFSIVFFIAIIFIRHRDIARYSLPLWPFAVIAYEKFFTSKKFLIISIILLPAIYLFAWNFMSYNVMPVGEWKPFL
jgi:4-amino-4-deoxy-L-arabinose transferase-like glycosyltransferase